MEFYGIKYEEYKSFNNCRPKSYQLDYNPYIQIVHTVKRIYMAYLLKSQ